MQSFEREAPGILGALLDAIAHGLANPAKLPVRPRMADFAEWVASCEGHFRGTRLPFSGSHTWQAGDFAKAYEANRKEATETVLGADPVAVALLSFMDNRTSWTGTATDLLSQLAELSGEDARRDKDWPRNARGLSGRLTRLAPALRKSGLEHGHNRSDDKKRTRLLTLSHTASDASSDAEPDGRRKPEDLRPICVRTQNDEKIAFFEATDAKDAKFRSPRHTVHKRADDDGCSDFDEAEVAI